MLSWQRFCTEFYQTLTHDSKKDLSESSAPLNHLKYEKFIGSDKHSEQANANLLPVNISPVPSSLIELAHSPVESAARIRDIHKLMLNFKTKQCSFITAPHSRRPKSAVTSINSKYCSNKSLQMSVVSWACQRAGLCWYWNVAKNINASLEVD